MDRGSLRRTGLAPTMVLAALLSAAAAAVVFHLATDLFAYRSVNDDEGVYLLQAAMLLKGQLFLHPGDLAEFVRPWFFVAADAPASVGGVRMYPKYAPVAAAVFALAKAVTGEYAVALAAVAAGNAALVYAVTAQGWDRETGVFATLALLGSPLFLVTSAVFLAYAPTTLFNLLFAFAYVRSWRRPDRRTALAYGALAGAAVGVAFFSRPYTAVLFATPFACHTLWSLRRARRRGAVPQAAVRALTVALPGLALVGVTLGYNAVVTSDPLTFPYHAFAAGDGLGFGERRLLGYSVEYTPALAVETTRRVLTAFLADWFVAGPVGVALALLGVAAATFERWRPRSSTAAVVGMPDREVRAVVAGVVPAVVVGEAYFWGTLNGLDSGLIELFGPYYHFDLLLPCSAFVAAGAVALGRGTASLVRDRLGRSRTAARVALAAVLLVGAPVVGAAEANVVADPVAENRLRTDNLAAAYAPFEEATFERAVVFTPTPYGDWQQHPFQYLRNDPGFDGDVVYATEGDAAETFRALEATEPRTPYRFTYRGRWVGAVEPVTPALRRLDVLGGDRVEAASTLGVPARATAASVRVETDRGYARYRVDGVEDALTVDWTVGPDGVRAANLDRAGGARRAALPRGASTVVLAVTFVEASGGTVTYRQELAVERADGRVRVVWPPETRVCRLTADCGRQGTYVGPGGDYLSGVSVESTVRARNASGGPATGTGGAVRDGYADPSRGNASVVEHPAAVRPRFASPIRSAAPRIDENAFV